MVSEAARNMVGGLGTHHLYLGENEMGKSRLAAGHLQAASETCRILVIDSKGEELFDAWPVAYEPSEAVRRVTEGRNRTVYRPEGQLLEPERLDSVIKDIYDARWSGIIYIDELEHVAPNAVPLPGMKYATMSGRRRKSRDGRITKMSLWAATHGARWIPKTMKREAGRYFVFATSADDLQEIGRYMADAKLTRPDIHAYWFFDRKSGRPARLMPPARLV